MTFKIEGITYNKTGGIAGACDCYLLKENTTTHVFSQVGSKVTSNSTTGAFAFTGLADNDPYYCVIMFKSGSPDVMDITDRNLVPVTEGGGGGSLPALFTTPGAGTFTVPAGVTSLTCEAWGPGGGGGGSTAGARSGGGGGYSKRVLTVTPAQTIYYNVGAGGTGSAGDVLTAAADSWVNGTANAAPTGTQGCIGGGGVGGATDPSGAGIGSLGTVNFNGGNGKAAPVGSGGGGGAGSGGNGADSGGVNGALGGAGGIDDGSGGGAGGTGATSDGAGGGGVSTAAAAPGGGGIAAYFAGSGSNGANGQVRFK